MITSIISGWTVVGWGLLGIAVAGSLGLAKFRLSRTNE